MATRTWNGATADWKVDADWTPNTSGNDVPAPGDTAVIGSGTVILTTDTGPNQVFENNPVTLGGTAGATLLLRDQRPLGRRFSLTLVGSATIEADGNRGFAGSLTKTQADGTVTLKADPGGNLVLLHGGSLSLQAATINLEGAITLQRDALIQGAIVNNGTLSIGSGVTTLAGSSLTGTGTIEIGSTGQLKAQSAVPTTQTVVFDGAGGTLALSSFTAPTFNGVIQNFAPGDVIDFAPNDQVSSAVIDTTAHRLTITEDTGQTYVINNFYGQAGALSVAHPGFRQDAISYASAPPQLNYQIDAGSRAIHADVVHGMTLPGSTTHITGAGVKIGIISSSFNIGGGAAADVTSGYLPASGVTVLQEGVAGDDDEGRAMAELIHQVAPGSSLYFSSTGNGVDDFAASVQALQAAGCTVIVDDISLIGSEPFFQLGSPADNAISAAIAGGVSYVVSDGNYGDAYYQHAFTTSQQTLLDGSVAQALTFGNGTPFQSITANGGLYDQIDLQWDSPFYGTGGVASDQVCRVAFKIFDASNALVGTSYQVSVDGHLVAESEFQLPYESSSTNYSIAIYQQDGTSPVGQIKYVLTGDSGGASVGGRINDADAGVGSGATFGHALVPGAVAVAAADVANTSASGRTPDFTESFSSTGLGTLLFDAAGNRLATPLTVGSPDVTAPDGIETSVSGFTPFYGTSAAAPNAAGVAALVQQTRPGISPADVATILAQSAVPLSGEPTDVAGAGLIQADRAVLLAEQLACFCAGTRILTDRGEVAVERLSIGDRVMTAAGRPRPIIWLGRRTIDMAKHPARDRILPIQIAPGALAPHIPARHLLLSPDHAVFAQGVLIPVKQLVNGTTIRTLAVDRVTYFHVELDSHDVILAEGMPCESYLETGNRGLFANSGGVTDLHPNVATVLDANSHVWEASGCAPLTIFGPEVDRVRAQIAARARTHAAMLHDDAGVPDSRAA